MPDDPNFGDWTKYTVTPAPEMTAEQEQALRNISAPVTNPNDPRYVNYAANEEVARLMDGPPWTIRHYYERNPDGSVREISQAEYDAGGGGTETPIETPAIIPSRSSSPSQIASPSRSPSTGGSSTGPSFITSSPVQQIEFSSILKDAGVTPAQASSSYYGLSPSASSGGSWAPYAIAGAALGGLLLFFLLRRR